MSDRKLKIVCMIGVLLLALQLIYPFALRYALGVMTNKSINIDSASSIGIIGGGEGPTAIFVHAQTSIFRYCFFAIGTIMIIVPIIIIGFKKDRK